MEPLPAAFFAEDADRVARRLLGQLLVHETPEGPLVARIVETEAYFGPPGTNPQLKRRRDLPAELRRELWEAGDPASHAGRGQTARSAVMWGDPGTAYVYLIYGMYECLNVVTGPEGEPQAVLLRAAEPVEGLERMQARRPKAKAGDLLKGPGRLAKAFGLSRALTGTPLTAPPVYFAKGDPPREVAVGPRVNVVGSEHYPLRFIEAASPHVSGARPVRKLPSR
ncbi:MAG TPA: DNA-3-methyladenine glycosylase [Candidatus Thermoplasmatota archaeon]|nr:DNA-3-methyladenine glycosylase [Candidatus Thermoplasmatota archaeon]